MLYRLVYISKASKDLDDRELAEILSVSRERNSRKEITGLLLFVDGGFLQVLEGEKNQVEKLYEHIGLDSRHFTVKRLQSGETGERLFGDWSMAYSPISPEEKRTLVGDGDFFAKFSASSASDEQTQELLKFIGTVAERMVRASQ